MAYKRRSDSIKHPSVELNITAFMNLMVVLVPFLLMTAVFTHMSILELNLPEFDAGKSDKNNKQEFELHITVLKNELRLSDNKGGLIKAIPATVNGHNYDMLGKTLKVIKARFPDKTNATILSQYSTSYDTLVQVMDATRAFRAYENGELYDAELFPDISIGDAARK